MPAAQILYSVSDRKANNLLHAYIPIIDTPKCAHYSIHGPFQAFPVCYVRLIIHPHCTSLLFESF